MARFDWKSHRFPLQLGRWMDSKAKYLARIAIARSKKSFTTLEDAYAQVDRMAKSTSGPFRMKTSDGSSVGPKKRDASTKDSSR